MAFQPPPLLTGRGRFVGTDWVIGTRWFGEDVSFPALYPFGRSASRETFRGNSPRKPRAWRVICYWVDCSKPLLFLRSLKMNPSRQVVVVTGASAGVGRAIVQEY